MNFINPIRPERGILPSGVVKGSSLSETTAAKVSRIPLPVITQKGGLGGRQFTLLQETGDLSSWIKTNWNALEPEELATKIIELEDKISLIKEPSPELEKVKRVAQNLHFKFVFPIALELEAPEGAVPTSFAGLVYKVAKDLFGSHSLKGFQELNRVQRQEVMRYVSGGRG